VNNLKELKLFITDISINSLFDLNANELDFIDFEKFNNLIQTDYKRYFNDNLQLNKLKYHRGLLATFFYRISRNLYLNNNEKAALEYSSLGSYLTSIELFYSAEIGEAFKINHGVGTVVGARVFIGDNVLLHQNVTLGEKNGRPKIKNNVTIFPGAVIVGDITIEENCTIGANSFLDKSLKSNTTFKL